MAFTHFKCDETKQMSRFQRQALSQLEAGFNGLIALMAAYTTMQDNADPTLDANYGEVVSQFGYPDTATAHAAWSELQSLFLKLSVDTSVSSVNTAFKQAFAKFR